MKTGRRSVRSRFDAACLLRLKSDRVEHPVQSGTAMGFLSGTVGFERFRVEGPALKKFGAKHIDVLERFAIGKIVGESAEAPLVGFLGGQHLFDQDFALEKNVVHESLHCGFRVDTNQVPAALRRAWLAIELAPLMAENPHGRVSKAQRQEAQQAVEARCEEEVKSGKFKRMQQFQALWDGAESMLYIGSSSRAAIEQGCDLFQRAFDLKLEHVGAGKSAVQWATDNKKLPALEEIEPAVFHADEPGAHAAWLNREGASFDFLGNEFLLWLWWTAENESDTIALADESEVVVMLNRTLTLECPRADSGKETITSESPVRLPEAHHALKFGKLPRKSGLLLIRYGIQYDFVLQAETFGVSGGKIKIADADDDDPGAMQTMRIDALRGLVETLDLLFGKFCERRLSDAWLRDVKQMRRWLNRDAAKGKTSAA